MKVQSKILRSKDIFNGCLKIIYHIICNTPRASGTSKAHPSGWAHLMVRHHWMPSNAVCESAELPTTTKPPLARQQHPVPTAALAPSNIMDMASITLNRGQ